MRFLHFGCSEPKHFISLCEFGKFFGLQFFNSYSLISLVFLSYVCSLILWERLKRTPCKFVVISLTSAIFFSTLFCKSHSLHSSQGSISISSTQQGYHALLGFFFLTLQFKNSPRHKSRVTVRVTLFISLLWGIKVLCLLAIQYLKTVTLSFVHFPSYLWWESKSSTSYIFMAGSRSHKEPFW